MVNRFRSRPVTREQLDSQSLNAPISRAVVYDEELYLLSDGRLDGPVSRAMATAHAINRALLAYPGPSQLRNVDVVFQTLDAALGAHPTWGYTKTSRQEYDNVGMVPGFEFYS